MNRRSRRILAASVPIGVALAVVGAGSALADPADFSLVVGIPAASYQGQPNVGAIDDRLQVAGEQVLTEPLLGLDQEANQSYVGDRFGASLLVHDLNGDGYDDLVVGAPGTASDSPGVPGQVDVLFGSPTGITTAGELTLHPANAANGDLFGSAVAVGRNAATGVPEYLYVGAPGRTVNAKTGAGAVMRYRIGSNGVPAYVDTITQDDPLVPGDARAGDHFGAVLASGDDGGAVVGVPDADVGAATDAGEIVHLRVGSNGAYQQGEVWTQDSAGVPGVAETGDHFGAALSQSGLVVGAPGEDVGSLKDAGAVQTFSYHNETTGGDGLMSPSAAYTQDSPGVPGKAEAGDDFGAAVAYVHLSCAESSTYAIGSPGEDIGPTGNAGSVTLIGQDSGECPDRSLSQGGGGIPGAAEAGDHVGAALGFIASDPDQEDDGFDTLLVGDPGENIGSLADTGRVYEVHTDGLRGFTVKTDHFYGGDATGLEFGSALPETYGVRF